MLQERSRQCGKPSVIFMEILVISAILGNLHNFKRSIFNFKRVGKNAGVRGKSDKRHVRYSMIHLQLQCIFNRWHHDRPIHVNRPT